ncbi:GIY-YIG nuclease family protein [Microbacterium telephonicum]|uniref:GIY-YIG catalytic domain-containing protein n=1 Tax=Microbacterium telephonicum TaxID=1714841 RepID=A0A498CD70_9MICO|nr:GIY-YIG nuclease family protein [Microbacterium telephonicum]RLK52496.1 GIY-YIG catalytic domain-containing protein [Microbacterium telephonicum]
MSSKSTANPAPKPKRPQKSKLPATDVQEFRRLLKEFLSVTDDQGRKWADAKWGVYAFYDYDGEPIYVGQTNEQLRVRLGRHLTNQRTDAAAMRILDLFEVAAVEIWPLWEYESINLRDKKAQAFLDAKRHLDQAEYTAYLNAIENSRFKAILNEKIPPKGDRIDLPASLRRDLITPEIRADRSHPDIRIARRAETISRLAAVARERGEVSEGLRRVLVIQAVRLAYIAAVRLAYAEGRGEPSPEAINVEALTGPLLYEYSDPGGEEVDANDASVDGEAEEPDPDAAD